MGAAKKSEMLPEEKYIQDALRDGRAFRTEVSLKAIGSPDTRFQARVDPLDLGHVNRLEGILEAEGSLHPIVVFFNPKTKKYLIADGFHRHDAYRRAKRPAIPAIQVEGDERDALEYCTMCNRLAMKGRTKEDVHKAVEMLLRDEVWRARSNAWIGSHVGCSAPTITAIRARLAAHEGVPVPDAVETREGYKTAYRRSRGAPTGRRPSQFADGRFKVSVDGKTVSARDEDSLRLRLAEIEEERKTRSVWPARFGKWASKRGFVPVFPAAGSGNRRRGQQRPGLVAVSCDFSETEAIQAAVGHLIASRRRVEPGARAVVVCYPDEGPADLIDLYRQEGIEFLTPEELDAELGAAGDVTPD